jgi:hypothetical protein
MLPIFVVQNDKICQEKKILPQTYLSRIRKTLSLANNGDFLRL